jgi:hypothetical protein
MQCLQHQTLAQDLFPCFNVLHTQAETVQYENILNITVKPPPVLCTSLLSPSTAFSLHHTVSSDRSAMEKVEDSPVMTACSHLFCCTCAVEMLRQKTSCQACGNGHNAPPISAGVVVCKVVGSLLLHCASCRCIV